MNRMAGCCAAGSAPALGAQALPPKTSYPGVAQLVARLLWEQEVARSSRVTRTKNKSLKMALECRFQGFLFLLKIGFGLCLVFMA